MAIGLRFLATLILLGLTIWLGWHHKSPWLIPVLALLYTPAYMAGQWSQIQRYSGRNAARQMLRSLPTIYGAQLVLAGIFFLSALGAHTVISGGLVDTVVHRDDLVMIGAAFVILAALSIMIIRAESVHMPYHRYKPFG